MNTGYHGTYAGGVMQRGGRRHDWAVTAPKQSRVFPMQPHQLFASVLGAFLALILLLFAVFVRYGDVVTEEAACNTAGS